MLTSVINFFQELEGALEQEEAKVLKVQLEMTQLKQEYERRLHEKDEDTESMRYPPPLLLVHVLTSQIIDRVLTIGC